MNGKKSGGRTIKDVDELCVNTIRMLSADAVQKANSGHAGMPMGAASGKVLNTIAPNLPSLDRNMFAPADGLARGAYILKDTPGGKPDLILLASGSEVPIAIEAANKLEEKDKAVRVPANHVAYTDSLGSYQTAIEEVTH